MLKDRPFFESGLLKIARCALPQHDITTTMKRDVSHRHDGKPSNVAQHRALLASLSHCCVPAAQAG